MKLFRFLKLLFLHVRLNTLRIKPGEFLVMRSKDVSRAYQLARDISQATDCFGGIVVAGPDISVDTVRTIPEETRKHLLAALLEAEV